MTLEEKAFVTYLMFWVFITINVVLAIRYSFRDKNINSEDEGW